MPEFTPIYEFPYPCPDETVDPSAFSALSNAIDAKLSELAADEQATLFRPHFRMTSVSNTAAAGVVHVTTGGGSSFAVPQAGVYMVTAETSPDTGDPATLNAFRLRVRVNGVPQFADHLNHQVAGGVAAILQTTGIAIVGGAGLSIDTDFLFSGSGNMDYTVTLDAKMICVVP